METKKNKKKKKKKKEGQTTGTRRPTIQEELKEARKIWFEVSQIAQDRIG